MLLDEFAAALGDAWGVVAELDLDQLPVQVSLVVCWHPQVLLFIRCVLMQVRVVVEHVCLLGPLKELEREPMLDLCPSLYAFVVFPV